MQNEHNVDNNYTADESDTDEINVFTWLYYMIGDFVMVIMCFIVFVCIVMCKMMLIIHN